MTSASILIVEDESVVALDLKLQLQDLGYRVTGIAASAEQALALAAADEPGLVLMDVRLRGPRDGIEVAAELRRGRNIPIIFLTSHSDPETVQRAALTAPYGYLTKPYQIKELRAGIEVALAKARLEGQLREADRWFAHTLNCVQDGVLVTELDLTVRFLNPAAESLTGWTLREAIGQRASEVVHLASPAASPSASLTQNALRSVLELGRAVTISLGGGLRHRNLGELLVDVSAGPVNDETGRPLGAVLVLRDARPRFAQQMQLRASEERFRNAFDLAPLGMALVSLEGEFIQFNDSLCRLLEITREALQSRGYRASTCPDDREHEAARLNQLLGDEAVVVQFEQRFLRADGATLSTLVSVSKIEEGGRITCFLYQIHDLTEQKLAAAQLAELAAERLRREAGELASRTKTEFLSRVSHEMRTPLNAVLGFAQLLQLQKGVDAEKTGEYANYILTAGHHLLALVTDLLDLQRAAQGTLRLSLEAVSVQALVASSKGLLENQAGARQIVIETEVPAGLRVLADAVRLRQVLLNLGSNAIKYNRPDGVITISARAMDAAWVQLTVEDGGIGMTEEQLGRLFQPFDRLGQERTNTPGVGLGLVIARDLITEMGGTLEVASLPRAGTRVTIRLPSVV